MFSKKPIKLIQLSPPPAQIVPLGQGLSFLVEIKTPGTEFRHYLKHQNLFYLSPLGDWMSGDRISVFPEAPGSYVLLVEWRQHDGKRGWLNVPFDVEGPVNNTPQLIELDPETALWTASEWEAMLNRGYESVIMDELAKLIKKGSVAYDVGANIGQYSLRLSRLVGSKGKVYSIEANPLCVYFLRANLQLNKQSNVEILPVALLHDSLTTDFTINYSNLGLGVTQGSQLYAGKAGHNIIVWSLPFDQLVERFNLELPDFVKIDIEGAEGKAVAGMRGVMQKKRPIFLIEVHGREAAEETFQGLDPFHYRYQNPHTRQEFSNAKELLDWFPNSVVQIICHPK